MRELLGAAVAVGSAVLYDAGYILEKQALTDLPPLKLGLAGLVRAAGASPRWLAGFLAMLAALGLQVGALTLAPVSVVQPIMAGGLIALAAAGSSLLGERLSRRHATALALVVLAVLAVGVSARGDDNLAEKVSAGRVFVMVALVAAVAAAAARWGLGSASERAGPRSRSAGLGGTALAAGLLYGLGAVAEKAVAVRLVSRGVIAGAISALSTPYPWIFVAATLAGMMVFQLGLQANPASLMAALTNTASTVCALIGASVVFGEAVLAPGWWSAARLAGFICVVAAVVALGGAEPPVPDPEAPSPVVPNQARPDHATAP